MSKACKKELVADTECWLGSATAGGDPPEYKGPCEYPKLTLTHHTTRHRPAVETLPLQQCVLQRLPHTVMVVFAHGRQLGKQGREHELGHTRMNTIAFTPDPFKHMIIRRAVLPVVVHSLVSSSVKWCHHWHRS